MVPQNGSKPSTAKDVLQKLTHLHELPQVILEWRKLNASVTKVVYPMSRAAKFANKQQMVENKNPKTPKGGSKSKDGKQKFLPSFFLDS